MFRSATLLRRSTGVAQRIPNLSQRRFNSTEQDLVVIGSGPGGYVAAIKAGQLGLKVSCIESRGTLGGTCLNVGCIPSKALLQISHKFEDAEKHFKDVGIKVGGVSIDVATLMKTKETRVKTLTSGIEALFKKNKVTWVKGRGKITSPNEVTIALNEGGQQVIKTKNILIATGSDVASPPGIKIDEKDVVSSTGALSLTSVPKDMVVIGGGVIGLELGSVWSRFGTKVTVVEFTGRIAAGADGEVAKELQKILSKQGLEFHLNTKVTKTTTVPGGVEVSIEDAKGGNPRTVKVEKVLACVGRRAFTDGLGAKEVGVKINERGVIQVDQHFRTNIPSIRAIGDVIPGPMLAHKAEEEGVAAVEDLVLGHGHVNYNAIPSVIYTNPEVAWVGLTEDEVKEKGINYKVGKYPLRANSRAITNGEPDGFVKFIAEAETNKLLGCHIVASNAGELIGESTLALEYGASGEDVARTCHAHPTLSEAVKEAAMMTYGKPINF